MQRPEIFTRDVGLEKNDHLGTRHTSDHHGIKISGFTPSYEVLGHLLKKKKNDDDENSDFAYERFLLLLLLLIKTLEILLQFLFTGCGCQK